MESNKILYLALAAVALIVLVIFLQPAIEERLAPPLRTAWVAIEVDGSGTAEIGPVAIEAGTPFKLHAVIEADGGDDGPLYYTAAPGLRIGGRAVDPGRLRRWDRPREARVRWFTVEGSPTYLELSSAADLERFELIEIYRSDWPLAWSVPGVIEPAQNDMLAEKQNGERDFGTQRYHVQIELYQRDQVFPEARWSSWGNAELRQHPESFPTVASLLPGRLAAISRIFGLAQLEIRAGAPKMLEEVERLARPGLAWNRATVLHDHLQAAGRRYSELSWRDADLVLADTPWASEATGSPGVAPGDLLRVGQRIVVLYQDRGRAGRLDYEDLAFDFELGAAVRPLAEVFSGDGVIELASLAPGEGER